MPPIRVLVTALTGLALAVVGMGSPTASATNAMAAPNAAAPGAAPNAAAPAAAPNAAAQAPAAPAAPGAANAITAGAADGLAPGLTLTDVASRGEGNWPRYRIPAVASLPGGDLLAVFDGRPSMDDLPSNIALLSRRSSDGGKTWQPTQTIRTEAAPNGFGDPSIVVDRSTGSVFVFYAASINAGFASSSTGKDPADPNVLHADYSRSTDGGRTWTHHRITADLKGTHTDWAGMFAASGEGIQLRTGPHAGRLIQQYTVRIGGQNYAVSAYSDDHGASWHAGTPVGPGADENKVAQLANGDVLLVSRAAPYRRVATSTDGGITYSPLVQDTELPDPANNGTVIRAYPDAPASDPRSRILLHSNTDNQNVRRNLTIRMSCDSGATWPVEKAVQTGATAYSTLTALPGQGGALGGRYGLMYEREGYRYISYTSFDLSWLGGACASLAVATPATQAPGMPGSLAVTVTNQSGAAMQAGRLALPAGSTWSSPGVAVPALAAGAAATVTVPITPPKTADQRTHTVRLEYRPGGTGAGAAGVDAAIPVAGAVPPAPALELRPVLDAIYLGGEPGMVGDRIQPWLEVFNTGNTTLTNITLNEPAGGSACNFSSLAPGASYVCRNNSPSHVITSADLQAGQWSTTYRASANAAGQVVSATAPLFPIDLTDPNRTLADGPQVWTPSGEFAASSFVRVPRVGDAGSPAGAGDLVLQVPASGRASAQLAVTASAAITGLRASVSTLTEPNGATLPAGTVQVRYPKYIPNEVQGGMVADPLQELTSLDVAAGTNQPIWFTVKVPAGAAPGVYAGFVDVDTKTGRLGHYPLKIVVPQVAFRPVAQRPFTLDLWSHPDAVADQLGLTPWSEAHFAALKPYWRDLAAAGQDVVNVAITQDPWLISQAGQLRAQTWSPYRSTVQWTWDGTAFAFDFSVFDRIVTDSRAAGIGKDIHAFAMLQFQSHDRIFYRDTRTGQDVSEPVTVGDARYRQAWGAFLAAFTAHLKAKGWFADTSLAFDEQPLARMNAAFDVLRQVDPQWLDKISLAANSLAEADIAHSISFNVSFLDAVPQSLIDQRRAAGEPTLFYTWNEPTAPNTVIPTPPFNTRALGWVVEQRDLDGYLRWTYNSWPQDVWTDPTYRYGQGDEYIVYPGPSGPMSSTRWELFQDGQDDAELLDLAKAKLGKDAPEVKAALAAVTANGAATPAAWQTMLDQRTRLIAALSGQASTAARAAVTSRIDGGFVARGGVAAVDITVTAADQAINDVKLAVVDATPSGAPPAAFRLQRGETRTVRAMVSVPATGDQFAAEVIATSAGRPLGVATARATVVDALAPVGDLTVDRVSVTDPTARITASVPVRNLANTARTVTLSASGASTFAAAPSAVTVAPGSTQMVTLVLDPQGRSGLDDVDIALTSDGTRLLGRHFALVSGGYFVSDAQWVSASNGWGPVERDTSNGEDAAGDGAPMKLNGRVYAKGVGAHAASTIVLDVGGRCNQVAFDYGIDDEVAAGGSVAFIVRADGAEKLRSATMTATSQTGSASVDITGASRIELVQDPLGANGQDHGDWANAWLRCT